MKKLWAQLTELWHKGSAHQLWMSLIALFVISAIGLSVWGENCGAAKAALTALGMVVIML